MFVTVLTIFGSILGLLVQILVAQSFGIGAVVDSYFFSLSWPLLIAGVISSALSFTLIPKVAALMLKQEADVGEYIWTRYLGLIIIIFAFAPVALFLTWTQLSFLDPYSPLKAAGNLKMLFLLAWFSAAFLVLKNFFVAVLHGLKYHVTAATLSLSPYICMTLAMVFLSGSGFGIALPLIAMIFGLVLSIVSAIIILIRLFGFFYSWAASIKRAVEFLIEIPRAGLALSCFSIYSIIDAYIAPRFGSGSLSTISLIQRFIIGVGNLMVSGVSSVVIHVFIRQINESNYTGFIRSVCIYSVGIFVGAWIVFLPLYFVSFEALADLFVVELKNDLDVLRLQSYVVTMIPGACAMLTSVVLMRILFCFDRGRVVGIFIGVLWAVLYSSLAMSNLALGLSALTTSYTDSWFIVVLALFVSVMCVARIDMAGTSVSETDKFEPIRHQSND